MSEYTLDLFEAVRALEENRCRGIKEEKGPVLELNVNNCLVHRDLSPVYLHIAQILGKWKLVGIIPEKKKIVLEDILWTKSGSGAVFPAKNDILFNWEELLGKPYMRMTLEWEET